MLRAFLFTAVILTLSGCAIEPMSPEEAASYKQMSDSLSRGSRDINAARGISQPQQQSNCMLIDRGGGIFTNTCN